MGGKISTVSTKARSSRKRMTAASSDVSWPTSTRGSLATGSPASAAWRSTWLILAAQPAKRASSVRRGGVLSGDVGFSGGVATFMAFSVGLGDFGSADDRTARAPAQGRAKTLLLGARQEIVERHAEAVERPGDEVVLADGEDRVHQLLGRVFLRQHGPGGVGDDRILVEIVGHLQERRLALAPARRLRPLLQPFYCGVGHAALPVDQLMLGELVLGLVQPADARDQRLAVAERQGLLVGDMAGGR